MFERSDKYLALTLRRIVIIVNDKQLIEKIADGNEGALELLYAQYYPRLVRFLYRVTADKEHIVEIVNDVFFIVWKNASKFRAESSVSTWILGIAYKKGLQSTRRLKSLTLIDDEMENVELCEDSYLGERNVLQLLRQLSPQHRAVMELTYYFGFSYKEISEIVSCPENTVKTRMFHGRQRLRAMMEEGHYAQTN